MVGANLPPSESNRVNISSPVRADKLLSLVHDLDDQCVHAYHLLEDGPGMNDLGDVRFVDA